MKKSRVGYLVVIAILSLAIYGTIPLVQYEFSTGNICPKILSIPACYIVFGSFVVAFIAHLIPFSNRYAVFFISVGLVTVIAIAGTLGEMLGLTKCPRTSSGIPMCFISLSICASLLLMQYINIKSYSIIKSN